MSRTRGAKSAVRAEPPAKVPAATDATAPSRSLATILFVVLLIGGAVALYVMR